MRRHKDRMMRDRNPERRNYRNPSSLERVGRARAVVDSNITIADLRPVFKCKGDCITRIEGRSTTEDVEKSLDALSGAEE
jgi:hypothetical protein